MNLIKSSIIKATSTIIAVNLLCSACILYSTNKHIGNNVEYVNPIITCSETQDGNLEVSTTENDEADITATPKVAIQTEELLKSVHVITKYNIPDMDTSFKTYMSYKCITNTKSEQYRLQTKAWTDEDGLRRIGDAYLVAMGTFYSDHCGKMFEVTFDTDETITVIVGDIKNDMHTDVNNQYSPVYDENGKLISANVLEFIVDTDAMSKHTKRLGTVENCANLQGNIVSIIELEDNYELQLQC